MNQAVLIVGLILIIAGFIITIAGSLNGNTKFSFVGFIGPFPIGFSNSKEMLIFGLILALVIIFALSRLP